MSEKSPGLTLTPISHAVLTRTAGEDYFWIPTEPRDDNDKLLRAWFKRTLADRHLDDQRPTILLADLGDFFGVVFGGLDSGRKDAGNRVILNTIAFQFSKANKSQGYLLAHYLLEQKDQANKIIAKLNEWTNSTLDANEKLGETPFSPAFDSLKVLYGESVDYKPLREGVWVRILNDASESEAAEMLGNLALFPSKTEKRKNTKTVEFLFVRCGIFSKKHLEKFETEYRDAGYNTASGLILSNVTWPGEKGFCLKKKPPLRRWLILSGTLLTACLILFTIVSWKPTIVTPPPPFPDIIFLVSFNFFGNVPSNAIVIKLLSLDQNERALLKDLAPIKLSPEPNPSGLP